ncbi:hypothetical protein Tco_1319326 [Tanacetum coccineum]
MTVQNQSQLGEGLVVPTDPHHTPTFIQPSTQPQKTQQPRKPKRKDTQVPQPSDPIEKVVDEVVHKELGDSLATPNESSSQGTNSGGGSWCQETMRDTTTQTRLKLDELMALCTALQNQVLDLEKTKTTQHNEIARLKRRVKMLEKKNRSRTHRLKRLYKVGLTVRVESSDNEESLGEDASKHERIDAIDADEEITLVSVHDVNVSASEEVFVAEQEVVDEMEVVEEVVEVINTANLIINAAQVSVVGDIVSAASATTNVSAATKTTATIKTVNDITLAQALEEMKSTKPKKKGVVTQELGESTITISLRLSSQQSQEKAKRAEEKRNKPSTKAQQRKIMCTYLKNMEGYKLKDLKLKEFDSIQEMFHRAFKKVNTFEDFRTELVEGKEKRVGTELIQEITKKQKVEDDKETSELKQLMEIIPDEEKVATNAIPLAVKEDLKDFYKLVKAKYESTRPVEDLDLLLWGDLKTMFEPRVEDEVWRNLQEYKVLDWKLYDSCGVHSLMMQSMQIYILVEKKYLLTPPTLSMMLEKKLIIDYESKMAYQLLKFIMKQLKKFVMLVKPGQELKIVFYHKLYDIVKQHQNEVNEIRAERLAPATKNRGKSIFNSSTPTYDQEPAMVADDDEMSKEKEIDKLMALISLSFKKIYKPTNNNLRTSSNLNRANQDNTPRINKGTRYDNQRAVNVVRARENIQEVTLDVADNFGPIFDIGPLQKVQNDNDNYNVFANDREHPKQPKSVNDTYLEEQDHTNSIIDSLDMSTNIEMVDQDNDDLARERDLLSSLIDKLKCKIDDSKNRNKLLESSNKTLVDKLKCEIKDFKTKNKSLESSNNHFKEANNELSKTNQLMFKDLKKFQAELDRYHDVSYASKVEIDCAKAKGDLMSYKMES